VKSYVLVWENDVAFRFGDSFLLHHLLASRDNFFRTLDLYNYSNKGMPLYDIFTLRKGFYQQRIRTYQHFLECWKVDISFDGSHIIPNGSFGGSIRLQ
jgi:hypothetical protein